MIHHGRTFGVVVFPSGHITWFTDEREAAEVEAGEVAKFAAADAQRERERLAKLGLKPDPAPYQIRYVSKAPIGEAALAATTSQE